MKKLIFAILVFSFAAQAHVSTGTFTGTDQNGKVCSFTVGAEWFENNLHHPLNERIPITGITFDGQLVSYPDWNVGHPPVVTADKGLVRFNHDIFQQQIATKVGGAAVIIGKSAEEAPQGHAPLSLTYIEDVYQSPSASKNWTCTL